MQRCFFRVVLSMVLLVGGAGCARSQPARAVGQGLREWDFEVGGVRREVLLYVPASATSNRAPVVFAFHGHGGNPRNAARTFRVHELWPEAIAVYMQGLPTPGRLTDSEGKKPGWQSGVGDQNDRDLKFFDAVLARLKKEFQVDPRRVYATGHSNGGGFTYLLWAARGEEFAAMAPSAAAARGLNTAGLRPKPAMHLAGQNDALVKFEWQRRMMDAVRKLNGCKAEGRSWAAQSTLYESPGGTPFVELIHPGGHAFPAGGAALIIQFFKEHPSDGR